MPGGTRVLGCALDGANPKVAGLCYKRNSKETQGVHEYSFFSVPLPSKLYPKSQMVTTYDSDSDDSPTGISSSRCKPGAYDADSSRNSLTTHTLC